MYRYVYICLYIRFGSRPELQTLVYWPAADDLVLLFFSTVEKASVIMLT